MSERKINLEEILLEEMDKFRLSFPDENLYSTEQIKESLELPYFKAAMKEACRQTLELAAENAKLEITTSSLVGPPIILDKPRINKQSILDTIKQENKH